MRARPRFDEVWAVDWSGARGRPRNIAVARLTADARMPELLRPAHGPVWTRGAVLDRLAQAIGEGRRVLAGFDFAFGLPVETLTPLGLAGCRDMPALWAAVDRVCAAAPDLHGGPFVAGAPAGVFWTRGPRPPGWSAALRLTDTRCAQTSGALPESVTKLVGAKQVGLAALSGMRFLAALRARCGPALAIWPAEAPERPSVAVEIFPTIHRRLSTGRGGTIRDAATLSRALDVLGCATPSLDRTPSDDETDALIAAAGMRATLRASRAFALPAAPRARREGWIFGVDP
jgi:hypothetical protein